MPGWRRLRRRDFQYLAANVVYKNTGQPIFPAYTDPKNFNGAKVGFIGLTLEGTPDIVSANGIQTVNFLDEADDDQRGDPGS